MKKNNLDFIVAGIQKAGTTMLSKHLSQNDQLFIPFEKELPFFLEKKIDQNNWNNFYDHKLVFIFRGHDYNRNSSSCRIDFSPSVCNSIKEVKT